MLHDENYKRLFAFPLMVEHLLRALEVRDALGDADFATLDKLSAEYVSDELLKRHGDAVWRIRLRDRWIYLLVMLEFQSRDDRWMALRILTYIGLLYEELVRNGAPEVAGGRLPPVLPVVLYNGATAWRAALELTPLIEAVEPALAALQPAQRYLVLDLRHMEEHDLPPGNLLRALAGLEQSRAPGDLLRVVQALLIWLRDPHAAELRRAFADWVGQMAKRLAPAGAALPVLRSLEDARMTLVERVGEWPAQWLREGREEGRVEGLDEGREQGLEHERALLCRMAATRFGPGTAERLRVLLASVADPDRLADVGDWLVRCNSADQFLAKIGSSTTS